MSGLNRRKLKTFGYIQSYSIQLLGDGHNSVYQMTLQWDIFGSRLMVLLQASMLPKQRLHTLFKAPTIFLTKYRVYAAIYSAVAVAKQKTRHLKPIRDATSLEYIAEISQQHIQVHQEPAELQRPGPQPKTSSAHFSCTPVTLDGLSGLRFLVSAGASDY